MRNHMYIKGRLLAFIALAILMMSLAGGAMAAALTGTVNADKVFFRMQPNTDSEFYARLGKGAKVALVTTKGEFYQVRYDGKLGYVMKKFVTVSKATFNKMEEATQAKSTSKYANTSSIKGLGDPPKMLKMGARGVDVEKLQRALQLKRAYKGVVDGAFGNQTREALLTYQRANGLKATGEADYNTIKKLFGNVSETTAANDPQMNGIKSISDIKVPNTTNKGSRGQHVKALQQALKLKGYYKAAIDSSYGDKTVEAVMAFQKRTGLQADGVAGNGTIRKLFGKDAANHTIKAERLNWFDAPNTIPKGAIFSVKDVSTGRVFTAKRWSGANHLDAEPLTSKDSSAIKAIFGGDWSWARRSILVKYNGHVYAASMNGMPHGTTTVDNNGFSGHFCVHFYNSKTHDTNRVDATHQNAVARAMNADW